MSYQLIKQIRGDSTLRGSFMDLAVKVFDLSFKSWYEKDIGRINTFPT